MAYSNENRILGQIDENLNCPKYADTKLLGNPWNTTTDCVFVQFDSCYSYQPPLTKWKMLSSINSVNDILGISSPVTILGKIYYSEVCCEKVSWDQTLNGEIVKKWEKWIKSLKECPFVSIPRSIVAVGGMNRVILHGFSDASKRAVCAAVYMVVENKNGTTSKNLLVSKARIAKKELSIPRLELVAALTLVKLIANVCNALQKIPIAEKYAWVDSTTVLYWLANKGTWSVFVRNKVEKIQEFDGIFRYVPTAMNPSDLGTRGCTPEKLGTFWKNGPEWLDDPQRWPKSPEIVPTEEASVEITKPKEKLFLETEDPTKRWQNSLIKKFCYWKLLRVTAYANRFVENCKKGKKLTGPLETEEIDNAERLWIKIAQVTCAVENKADNNHLKKESCDIWRYHGRVPGYLPIFIPRQHLLTVKLITHHHNQNFHGGVQSTIAKIRETFWIPRIRRETGKVISKCYLCRRYRVKPLPSPVTYAELPDFRAKFVDAFAAVGVDFAGPLLYKNGSSVEKAYIALFTCAATRAVHLKVCLDMTAIVFKIALKEFIARRGAPQIIVSDNAKTFITTNTWLKRIQNDDDVHNYLATQKITWRFNLSRAPWWGGFFERMIGVMKNTFSKVVGKALLKFSELEEVMLDIESHMNNRPLCYVGEEFADPVITPNILIRGKAAVTLNESATNFEDVETKDVVKRLRFLEKCKDDIRKRWTKEYLYSLEERNRKTEKTKVRSMPTTGAVVLIKDSIAEKRGRWKLGRIEDEIRGKDGVLRGYKIKMGTGYVVERPVQLVADLEITDGHNNDTNDVSLNVPNDENKQSLNPEVDEFEPRASRMAKEVAKIKIKEHVKIDMGEL